MAATRSLNTWVFNQGVLVKKSVSFVGKKMQMQTEASKDFPRGVINRVLSGGCCCNDYSNQTKMSAGAVGNAGLLWCCMELPQESGQETLG